MEATRLTFTEIIDPADPLFLEWLDLYETAFPPSEKMLVSTLLKKLKMVASGEARALHFLSVQNEGGTFVGMMLYRADPSDGIAALWYLAIKPSERSHGLGTIAYQYLIKRLDPSTYEALLLEVEIPRKKNAEEAERRITFYRRQGTLLLDGIHYLQFIGWHHPPTPMHLMVHPIRPLDPERAFALAKSVFGEAIHRRGTLRLR